MNGRGLAFEEPLGVGMRVPKWVPTDGCRDSKLLDGVLGAVAGLIVGDGLAAGEGLRNATCGSG